jgi:hypothetical protein
LAKKISAQIWHAVIVSLECKRQPRDGCRTLVEGAAEEDFLSLGRDATAHPWYDSIGIS